jgi:hypothetical protein
VVTSPTGGHLRCRQDRTSRFLIVVTDGGRGVVGGQKIRVAWGELLSILRSARAAMRDPGTDDSSGV